MLPQLLVDTKKLPKMGQNSTKSPFFAGRAKKASAKGRSPLQEQEVGPHSRPYLLVSLKSIVLTYSFLITLDSDENSNQFQIIHLDLGVSINKFVN